MILAFFHSDWAAIESGGISLYYTQLSINQRSLKQKT